MDINALLHKYEDELDYYEFDDRFSVQTAIAIVRLAIKEVAANADEGWREATKLNACLAEAQNVRPYAERIHQLEDELAHIRQSWQKDAAALALALSNVERLEEEALGLRATLAARDSTIASLGGSSLVNLLEEENKQLRQAVDNAVAMQRLYHQRWVDIREWAKKGEVNDE